MGIHKNRKGGTIVNIASVAGLDPILITPVYTASKSAVVGFSRALEVNHSCLILNVRLFILSLMDSDSYCKVLLSAILDLLGQTYCI